MLDPNIETLRFAVFALVIGVVIFGGTTLTYFLDKRRPDPPSSVPAHRLHEPSRVAVAGDNVEVPRDQAA